MLWKELDCAETGHEEDVRSCLVELFGECEVKMGFSNNWVCRIVICLASFSLAFKINGHISGSELPASRGIRQGDPISPN